MALYMVNNNSRIPIPKVGTIPKIKVISNLNRLKSNFLKKQKPCAQLKFNDFQIKLLVTSSSVWLFVSFFSNNGTKCRCPVDTSGTVQQCSLKDNLLWGGLKPCIFTLITLTLIISSCHGLHSEVGSITTQPPDHFFGCKLLFKVK